MALYYSRTVEGPDKYLLQFAATISAPIFIGLLLRLKLKRSTKVSIGS